MNEIVLKYEPPFINFYKDNLKHPEGTRYNTFGTEYNFNNQTGQKVLRYLDSKKDLLGLTGFDTVIAAAYNVSQPLPPYTLLKAIKNSYITAAANSITTKSWAKTKTRDSLNINLVPLADGKTYMFREVGLNLKDDIIDTYGNKSEPTDVSCFSNTILDPFIRSFKSSSTEHFPPKDYTLRFDQTFLDFLGFYNCTNVSSTLTDFQNQLSDNIAYIYDYNITYNDPLEIKGNINYPRNSNNITDPTKIEKYVIGNEDKKTIISSFTSQRTADTEYKKKIVQIKEMGDVLQVYSMLAWMKTYNINVQSFFMSTNDSIVFLMCITLGLPCILLEFKDENEDNPVPQVKNKLNGRTRYLQRYLPTMFTQNEKLIILKNEIKNVNNKIRSVIMQLSNKKVFISKTESIKINLNFLGKIATLIDNLNRQLDGETLINDNFDEQKIRNYYIFNEIFYFKNGNYYASTFVSFFTADKTRLPCNRATIDSIFVNTQTENNDLSQKMVFSLLCQKYKTASGGGTESNIIHNNLHISENFFNYTETIITEFYKINLYKELFSDIYDGALYFFNERFRVFNINFKFLDSYVLYDLYISLCNVFFEKNEVFYLNINQALLPQSNTDQVLDNYIEEYINTFVESLYAKLQEEMDEDTIDNNLFKNEINKYFQNENINEKKKIINIAINSLISSTKPNTSAVNNLTRGQINRIGRRQAPYGGRRRGGKTNKKTNKKQIKKTNRKTMKNSLYVQNKSK